MLPVENRKNEYHHWILHNRISLSTNFQLKLTIVLFWTTFAQKGICFQSKADKIDTTIEFRIFESSLYQISLEQAILNLWTEFIQNGYLWSKTEKVTIIIKFCIFKIVLVSNLRLNWQTWYFWQDLPQKRFFWSKTEKVNTTTEFCIFKLF